MAKRGCYYCGSTEWRLFDFDAWTNGKGFYTPYPTQSTPCWVCERCYLNRHNLRSREGENVRNIQGKKEQQYQD